MSKRIRPDGVVTVVVPAYNRELYIGACITSILQQTHQQFRILVVDDGSTDNTVTIVKDLMEKDKRIELKVHAQNTGSMNSALHDAILDCQTQYFTWIGSDDTYIPSALSQLVSQHQQHPEVDYVSCDLKMTRESHPYCNYCGSAWPNWTGYASLSPFKNYDKRAYASLVYRSLCPPFPWNGMWKTDFFRRNNLTWIEYKGNTWSPDTLNGLQFFAHDMQMLHYNEFPLIIYRLHDTQDTVTGAVKDQIRCDVTLIDAIHEWFTPEEFLGKSLSTLDLSIEYLNRLRDLIQHHHERHASSEMLTSVLSDVATSALVYMWKNEGLAASEAGANLSKFFKSYL